MTAERTAINPWPWSTALGYSQAQLVTTATLTLHVAGQTAMSADGEPQHPGDLAAQLTASLDNLEAVLTAADMTLADVVRLNVYTTDVDALFPHYGLLAGRLAAAGVAPASTLLGVARLAIPTLLVELEATAVR